MVLLTLWSTFYHQHQLNTNTSLVDFWNLYQRRRTEWALSRWGFPWYWQDKTESSGWKEQTSTPQYPQYRCLGYSLVPTSCLENLIIVHKKVCIEHNIYTTMMIRWNFFRIHNVWVQFFNLIMPYWQYLMTLTNYWIPFVTFVAIICPLVCILYFRTLKLKKNI